MRICGWFHRVVVGRFFVGLIGLQISFITSSAAPFLAFPFEIDWTPNPDPTLGGYVVYYGVKGSSVTSRIDVGTNCFINLADLQAETNYFFYVVSYDTNGLEGSPSGEIDYVPPALSESIMTFATDGSTTVQFRAGTGALCHVEYTTALNPAQWQWLAADTADTNGYGAVTDRTDRATSRFYRIAEP